jgi:serine phosphatase RsbU (regulator of sigma subunit)
MTDAPLLRGVAALVSAAARLVDGARIVVVGADGVSIATSTGADVVAQPREIDPAAARRVIEAGSFAGGHVAVTGDGPAEQRERLAEVVAAGLGLAAGDAAARPRWESHDHDRHEGELAIGRQIQRSLMPRRFPNLPGWEIAAAYDAAREVGGDLYDAFQLRDRPGVLAFVVADVTGKGIPAALVMADVRALIHAAADHGGGPATTLGRVNTILVAERATGLFVTVAHAEIDAGTGRFILASAGHEPVHIVRADGRLEILEPRGRLIGMVSDVRLEPMLGHLDPGDAVIAHTDGITEARSVDGAFYGDDRYRRALADSAGLPAADIVDRVLADVATFRGGAEAFDDLTLLVVRRGPEIDADAGSGGSVVVDLGGDVDVDVEVATG